MRDPELYCIWLETHHELSQKILDTKIKYNGYDRPMILGSGARIYDNKTGICTHIIYANPGLEAEEEVAAFFRVISSLNREGEISD